MKLVFADTFYFLALFNPQDAAHARAIAAVRTLKSNVLTTDWVLTETADALCDSVNRISCAQMINDLRSSPHVEIVPASRRLFEAGWNLYQQRADKDWSLTDCTSFVVMQERGINEALTGDHHFEQAGFQALIG